MDYEGKYFPDEPNENQSKTSRNVKRVFKFLFYGAVVAVYIACFAALICVIPPSTNITSGKVPNPLSSPFIECFNLL